MEWFGKGMGGCYVPARSIRQASWSLLGSFGVSCEYLRLFGNDIAGLALRTVIDILTDNDNRLTSSSFAYRISTN